MLISLKDLSVAGKAYLISAIFMIGMLFISVTSWTLMNTIEHGMVEIAEEDVPLIRALSEITVNSLEQAVLVERILPAHNKVSEKKAFHEEFGDRSANNKAAFEKALALTDQADVLAATPEARDKIKQLGEEIRVLQTDYESYLVMAEAIFDKAESGQTITAAERDEIEAVQKDVDHRIEEELLAIEDFAAAAASRAEANGARVLQIILIVSAIASLLGGIATWLLVRAVASPLRQMASSITEMASGNTVDVPCLANGDEVGVLARSLEQVLQKGLEATRLRQALDRCTTMMMVANRRHEIIYVNPALRHHLKQFEAAIRVDLPKFAVDGLVGTDIGVIQKDSDVIHKIVDDLKTMQELGIRIGGRRLNLTINPVTNEASQPLGTVIEWQDNTEDLTMRESINRLVVAVQEGNFDERIDLAEVGSDHRAAAEGMNAFAKAVDDATRDIGAILTALADGDLTRRIDTDYEGRFGELKDNANSTASQLSKIVAQIQNAAGALKNASSEITSGTEDLSRRTEQAAANLEETAASTEEMSATVRQNAENSKSANELAGGADKSAKLGGQVVEQAVSAMAGIEDSAQKITDIIGVIDEIAFQTNLLALNASVEAARAGEAGKGFAVVAQEVRQLAQRSAQAADDIKNLIQDSNSQVKDGVQLVNRAGEALTEIVNSIGKVATIVQEISSASQEQALGVQEINGSISSMDEMTQQNSALVEESTAASRVLGEEAGKLTELTAFFKHDEHASTPTQRPGQADQPRDVIQRKAPASTPAMADAEEGWDEF